MLETRPRTTSQEYAQGASTMTALAIQTQGLSLRYGRQSAVVDLNLSVARGEIFGFLGPNGAGKTSTIALLLGLRRPTSGRVWLLGEPLTAWGGELKRRVGVVGDRQRLYDTMTVGEYLRFFASLYGVAQAERRIRALTEAVDLAGRLNTLAVHLSHGMQQKLGFVRALLHDPELLILDEPVSGLDPHGIRQIRDLIIAANNAGKTIFISSHILSEIERTAHRVGILHRGRLLAEDSMANLRRRLDEDQRFEVEIEGDPTRWAAGLRQLAFVRSVERVEGRLIVHLPGAEDNRADLSRWIHDQGGAVLGLRRLELSLEEAFLTITDQNLSLLAQAAA